jgi:glycosyltransferase involved in cell wall biosynthesis
MEAITRTDRVSYVGFVTETDKVALLRGCAAFVFPSLHEGFGFPVLEALAAGAPVISCDSGALKEVLGPAWRIEGHDRAAIRAAVMAALADSAWSATCIKAGPAWAERFDWSVSVNQHLQVYQASIDGRPWN